MFKFQIFGSKKENTDRLMQEAAIHFAARNFERSIEIYHSILQGDPNNFIALNELGRIYLLQRNYTEAIAAFRDAISLRPDASLLYRNLAAALSEVGLFEESFASYREYAKLMDESERSAASAQGSPIAAHRQLHDQEQREYLSSKSIKAPPSDGDTFVFQAAERIEGSAVNPRHSAIDIAEAWQHANPKLLVIDDVLTEEALQRLRHFCWGSTVWKRVYKNGYLGALPEHGFGSPLLAQIIEELRTLLFPVVGDLPLLQFWAFKYSSGMKGVDVHADFSAVNVNLWITPDEATDDPDGGGLIVWDKAAPSDWDFETYNQNKEAARDFLAASGAKPTIIPHRSNRAVVFIPSLFHETDRINFKPGYLNRRINITLLFGRREDPAVSSAEQITKTNE